MSQKKNVVEMKMKVADGFYSPKILNVATKFPKDDRKEPIYARDKKCNQATILSDNFVWQ